MTNKQLVKNHMDQVETVFEMLKQHLGHVMGQDEITLSLYDPSVVHDAYNLYDIWKIKFMIKDPDWRPDGWSAMDELGDTQEDYEGQIL